MVYQIWIKEVGFDPSFDEERASFSIKHKAMGLIKD